MQVVRSIKKMQQISDNLRKKGKIIGLVPTMGALHKGHLRLIEIAKKKSDFVVVSIFVNPKQFGPGEDFRRYPRTFQQDKKLAQKVGCDLIFNPDEKQMYPKDFQSYVIVEKLSQDLEGARRPGHFKGVTTVVAKLFNIVKPHLTVFGQKDAQQAVIVKKMIEDLNFDLKFMLAPTFREQDGLAASSRNSYLSAVDRQKASVLYRALRLAEKMIEDGERDGSKITAQLKKLISEEPTVKLDYIAVTDSESLIPVEEIKGKVLISLAAFMGNTRLIDNITIKVKI